MPRRFPLAVRAGATVLELEKEGLVLTAGDFLGWSFDGSLADAAALGTVPSYHS